MTGFDAIREICNLTYEDVANMLNIKKQSVYEWGKNGKPIPQKRVQELSDKLGIAQKYFNMSEIDPILKLELQSDFYFHNVKGVIQVESFDDDEDDEIEEVDGHPVIRVTPKNFDTDPRFAKIYQNQLQIGLLQDIQSITDMFETLEKSEYESEKERSETLKYFCDIVSAFADALYKADDYNELLRFLGKYSDLEPENN